MADYFCLSIIPWNGLIFAFLCYPLILKSTLPFLLPRLKDWLGSKRWTLSRLSLNDTARLCLRLRFGVPPLALLEPLDLRMLFVFSFLPAEFVMLSLVALPSSLRYAFASLKDFIGSGLPIRILELSIPDGFDLALLFALPRLLAELTISRVARFDKLRYGTTAATRIILDGLGIVWLELSSTYCCLGR